MEVHNWINKRIPGTTEGTTEIENHHSVNATVMAVSAKNHQGMPGFVDTE